MIINVKNRVKRVKMWHAIMVLVNILAYGVRIVLLDCIEFIAICESRREEKKVETKDEKISKIQKPNELRPEALDIPCSL